MTTSTYPTISVTGLEGGRQDEVTEVGSKRVDAVLSVKKEGDVRARDIRDQDHEDFDVPLQFQK